MRLAFADTAYWIARAFPHDQHHKEAVRARRALGATRLVTTDEVLTEFLNKLSDRGPYLRRFAAETVDDIMSAAEIVVLPQSRHSSSAGLALYRTRADKGYSLTDCISMAHMRVERIHEVLTSDLHIRQEGFAVLMRS